jgi:TPR repeat protein
MNMYVRNHLGALLVVAAFAWTQSVPAQDFQAGREAVSRGDFATALAQWQPLAEAGDATAQYNLGMLHARGEGVPQDYEIAAKWFKRAAEQGQRDAQATIGGMYARGLGIEQDYEQAAEWLLLAAKQHHAPSQFEMGILHAKGQGVLRDDSAAYFWIELAARQNYQPAIEAKQAMRKFMPPVQIELVEKRVDDWLQSNSAQ